MGGLSQWVATISTVLFSTGTILRRKGNGRGKRIRKENSKPAPSKTTRMRHPNSSYRFKGAPPAPIQDVLVGVAHSVEHIVRFRLVVWVYSHVGYVTPKEVAEAI